MRTKEIMGASDQPPSPQLGFAVLSIRLSSLFSVCSMYSTCGELALLLGDGICMRITEYPGLEGIHRDHRVQCLYLCSVALCLTIARYTGQFDKGYLETFKWLFLVGGQHPEV